MSQNVNDTKWCVFDTWQRTLTSSDFHIMRKDQKKDWFFEEYQLKTKHVIYFLCFFPWDLGCDFAAGADFACSAVLAPVCDGFDTSVFPWLWVLLTLLLLLTGGSSITAPWAFFSIFSFSFSLSFFAFFL